MRSVTSSGRQLRDLGRAALDWLGPAFCRSCDVPLPPGAGRASCFCADCAPSGEAPQRSCRRCALPLPPTRAADDLLCVRCRTTAVAFDVAVSGGPYEGALRRAILRYKFGADLGVVPFLRDLMLAAVRAEERSEILARSGALVPVPAHVSRALVRGWDPVLELARALSPHLDLPVLRALSKRTRTPAQSRLRGVERRRNLRGAFVVPVPEALPDAVVLLDDVLTTGTTASRCAAALKASGVRAVAVLTAARAVPAEDA